MSQINNIQIGDQLFQIGGTGGNGGQAFKGYPVVDVNEEVPLSFELDGDYNIIEGTEEFGVIIDAYPHTYYKVQKSAITQFNKPITSLYKVPKDTPLVSLEFDYDIIMQEYSGEDLESMETLLMILSIAPIALIALNKERTKFAIRDIFIYNLFGMNLYIEGSLDDNSRCSIGLLDDSISEMFLNLPLKRVNRPDIIADSMCAMVTDKNETTNIWQVSVNYYGEELTLPVKYYKGHFYAQDPNNPEDLKWYYVFTTQQDNYDKWYIEESDLESSYSEEYIVSTVSDDIRFGIVVDWHNLQEPSFEPKTDEGGTTYALMYTTISILDNVATYTQTYG